MVKKIFVILILVAILINSSWLIGNNTYAVTYISNAINMKTDKEKIKVGESITVSLYITGTMSYSSKAMKNINMSLTYDSDLFECTDIVSPKNNYKYGTITINDEGGKIVYKYEASSVYALGNGTTLINITFKAKKDGKSKMKLSYTARDNDTSKIYGEDDLELSLNVSKDAVVADINGDGKINIQDWNMLYEYIKETITLSDEELQRADVNGDGKVNIKDWNRLYDHITEVNPL